MLGLNSNLIASSFGSKRDVGQILNADSDVAPFMKKAKYNDSSDEITSNSTRSSSLSGENVEVDHIIINLFEESIDSSPSNNVSEEQQVLSCHTFYTQLKALTQYGDFQKRISMLWQQLFSQPAEDGDDLGLLGRFCWIQDPISADGVQKKSMLFRLYKDVFSSTALGEGAYPPALKAAHWYRIELLEYIFDEHSEEGGHLRDYPEEFLLDMHIDPSGMYSGIDWIRKGDAHTGTEIKKVAMKIAKHLGVRRETLCDQSKISSGVSAAQSYSMKLVFSLLEHEQYSRMSWYERDGFIAMHGENIIDAEEKLVSQNNLAYYQAFETVRMTPVCHLYSNVLRSAAHKKQLLQAYQLLNPATSLDQLLADSETNLCMLFNSLWKARSVDPTAAKSFHFLYTQLLTPVTNLPVSPRFAEARAWNETLKIIDTTNFFIRTPNISKKSWHTDRRQLLANIDSPAEQARLQQLGTL